MMKGGSARDGVADTGTHFANKRPTWEFLVVEAIDFLWTRFVNVHRAVPLSSTSCQVGGEKVVEIAKTTTSMLTHAVYP